MSKKINKEDLVITSENRTIGQLKMALNELPDDAIIEDMFIDLDINGEKGTLIPTKKVDKYCECDDTCTCNDEYPVNPMNPEYDLYPGEFEDTMDFINYISNKTANFVSDMVFECVSFNRQHRVNHLTEMCKRYIEEE